MKKPKLTPWFNIAKHGQPKRPGFYQVAYTPGAKKDKNPPMNYWDGLCWRVEADGPMLGFGNFLSDFDRESWRGLANPPKETKQKGEK